MKKRITLAISVIALVLGLTACGSTADETYGGYTAEDLEYYVENTMASVSTMSADEALAYADQYSSSKEEGAAVFAEMFRNWAVTSEAGLGDALGTFSEFSIDKTGKTLTVSAQQDYSVRNCKITVVFKTYNMELSSINIEPVYTLGETMGKAGLNTIMGIMIVFFMLIVMSIIIYLFKFVNAWGSAPKKKAEKKVETPAPASTPAAATVADATDDLELVAVIAAAIAASTGASTDSFVVRSIRKRY